MTTYAKPNVLVQISRNTVIYMCPFVALRFLCTAMLTSFWTTFALSYPIMDRTIGGFLALQGHIGVPRPMSFLKYSWDNPLLKTFAQPHQNFWSNRSSSHKISPAFVGTEQCLAQSIQRNIKSVVALLTFNVSSILLHDRMLPNAL